MGGTKTTKKPVKKTITKKKTTTTKKPVKKTTTKKSTTTKKPVKKTTTIKRKSNGKIVYDSWKDGSDVCKDKKGYYIEQWNPKTEMGYKKYLAKSWKPTTETETKKPKKTTTTKKPVTKKTTKKSTNKITVNMLKALKKKYGVITTTSNTKEEIAERLWMVHGTFMDNDDLDKILHLLSKRDKKDAEELLLKRNDNPVLNYKGMWKPLPKPLSKMTRTELIKHLRSFRDVWERETMRSQDLSDMRLKEEPDKELRRQLEFYFSDQAKQIAGDWLRKSL